MYATLGFLKSTAVEGGGGGGGGGPVFPIIESVTVTQDNTAPYLANMPATVAANDLLILLGAGVDPGDFSGSPSGWTLLASKTDTLNADARLYYKWAAGTEGGTSVSVFTSGPNAIFAVLRLTSALVSQNPEAGFGIGMASTNIPDPPIIDPSWITANNLIIAISVSTNTRSIVSYPAGYTFHQQSQSSSEASVFVAAKQVIVSSAENPGVFTISSPTNCYVATIAVRGA